MEMRLRGLIVAILVHALSPQLHSQGVDSLLISVRGTVFHSSVFRSCAEGDAEPIAFNAARALADLEDWPATRRRALAESVDVLRRALIDSGGCAMWSESELAAQRRFTEGRIDSLQRHAPFGAPLGLRWGMTITEAEKHFGKPLIVMDSLPALLDAHRGITTTIANRDAVAYLLFDRRWGLVSADLSVEPRNTSECDTVFNEVVTGVSQRYPLLPRTDIRRNDTALPVCDALTIDRATLGAVWRVGRSEFILAADVANDGRTVVHYRTPEGVQLLRLLSWYRRASTY